MRPKCQFFDWLSMEFNKTKWTCPWNSDKNCTQNSARGWWGSGGGGRWCGSGGWGVVGSGV